MSAPRNSAPNTMLRPLSRRKRRTPIPFQSRSSPMTMKYANPPRIITRYTMNMACMASTPYDTEIGRVAIGSAAGRADQPAVVELGQENGALVGGHPCPVRPDLGLPDRPT